MPFLLHFLHHLTKFRDTFLASAPGPLLATDPIDFVAHSEAHALLIVVSGVNW